MSRLRWYLSTTTGVVLEITNRVRLPIDPENVAIGVGGKAEAGSGWEGDLLIDDPAGDLIPLMYRRIYCNDDDAVDEQVIGNWFISNLKVQRMDPWNGVSRTWVVTMADENCLLGRRKFVGTDSNRPEETDITRLRWALTTTEMNTLDPDETYIDTTNPITMDAHDYRQEGPDDLMASLMAVSGKHYWVMYREDLTPHVYSLWYANQNTSTLYASTISLSNVASEIGDPPSTLVYPLSADAELDRAGGRMASGLVGQYKNNWLYEQDSDVGDTYAYVDRVAPLEAVSSLARADAAILQQLHQLALPDDEITTTWNVESDNLNLIKHGMIVPVHASHFPNYTPTSDAPGYAADYVNCRVVERTIRQVGTTTFEVPLRLSPMTTLSCSTQVSAISVYDSGNLHQASGFTTAVPISSPSPAMGIVLFGIVNGGTDVGSGLTVSGWTATDTYSSVAYDHLMSGMAYLSVPTVTDLVLSWTGTTNYERILGFSISTSATTPVQSAVLPVPGTGKVLTLGASPTAGNLLVMGVVMNYTTGGSFPYSAPTGWSQVNAPVQISDPTSLNPPFLVLYTHCVEAGESNVLTWGWDPPYVHYFYLSEWAFV